MIEQIQNPQEVSQEVLQQESSHKKRPYFLYAVILCVLGILFISLNFFLNSSRETLVNLEKEVSRDVAQSEKLSDLITDDAQDDTPQEQESEHNFFFDSEYKAFVKINSNNAIDITPIDSAVDPYTMEKYAPLYSGGSLGYGITGVVLAPDLEKFAFVYDEKAIVLSTDGKTELELPVQNVEYILGWSPDSSQLLAYTYPESIARLLSVGGPGAQPIEKVSLDKEIGPFGFVLINFTNDTIRYMYELDDMLVYAWVGNDALITSSGIGQNEFFVYYSLSKKTADKKYVSALNDVFGNQMSFTPDGSKWSTVTSVLKDDISIAQATIGNFPTMGDIATVQFPWATRQKPVISPNGSQVALVGYEVLNGPEYVYLYDGQTLEKIVEGKPELWLEDTLLLCTQEDKVFILNTVTKEVEWLRLS